MIVKLAPVWDTEGRVFEVVEFERPPEPVRVPCPQCAEPVLLDVGAMVVCGRCDATVRGW